MNDSLAKRPNAVVLLSGGLDSTTVLAMAAEQGFAPYALSFQYGQRHAHELLAAEAVARKLLASLEAPVLIGHEEVCVGASIGIAIRPADGLDAKDLLRAADSAMYLAKRQGGTRICSPSDLLSGAGAMDVPRSALGEPMDATPQLRAVRPAEPERAQFG